MIKQILSVHTRRCEGNRLRALCSERRQEADSGTVLYCHTDSASTTGFTWIFQPKYGVVTASDIFGN